MHCQLWEQLVWERVEGGKHGGELIFWGHSKWKDPGNTAPPKAWQQTLSWALFCSQESSQLLVLPRFHQNEEAACTDTKLGPQNLCSYQKRNYKQEKWFPLVMHCAACFKPSSSNKPDAQFLWSCSAPAGRGSDWPWTATGIDKDRIYLLSGTDINIEPFLSLALIFLKTL